MIIRSDKKPEWLKIKLDTSGGYSEVDKIVKEHSLHTICSSGMCPNKTECWSRGTATFMILGNICTRSCRFCATITGKPLIPNIDEPAELAESVSLMKLKHCVITSVTRDDLPDGGASHWASVIKECLIVNPDTTIEVLIPDFDAREELIDIVLDARPHIVAHNIETVKRLTPSVRSRAKYEVSLQTINYIARKGFIAKSGIMLGLGESEEEVMEALTDLQKNGCSVVTIGQYLRPSLNHLPVVEYINPVQFDKYKEFALKIGFTYAESGPLVRSSYRAEKAMGIGH
ncbi:MAG: lipoyl synthase [Bacteroidetes bacterium GWF2_40_14]|nr:MAG: lipoyl synthase [Bacteroidetes bacterium GWF2_40_14]